MNFKLKVFPFLPEKKRGSDLLRLVFALFLVISATLSYADEPTTPPRSAFDIWLDMTEAGINFEERPILVEGATEIDPTDGVNGPRGNIVMFGAEKEGSSALITRVMGPGRQEFTTMLNEQTPENQEIFLRQFLEDLQSGRSRVREVRSAAGELQTIDYNRIQQLDIANASVEDLRGAFDDWLEQAGDRNFSFLKRIYRQRIFNGRYPGIDQTLSLKKRNTGFSSRRYGGGGFGNWNRTFYPLYGEPELYIQDIHGTSVGWEINFVPQRNYGDFERMISYFRAELANMGERFQAPGHQWIVMPKPDDIASGRVASETIEKLGEMYKMNQAYTVLRGIAGRSGIENSNYKQVQTQAHLGNGKHDTGRGVLRLEDNRFKVDGQDSYNIEMRAGTKNDSIRRFIQQSIVSRYASGDFSGIADVNSWTLNPAGDPDLSMRTLMRRFDLNPTEATQFRELILANYTKTSPSGYMNFTENIRYFVPLWNWEDAPFLSANKKRDIRNLTTSFIKTLVNMDPPANREVIGVAMENWTRASRLSYDIEEYLRPRPSYAGTTGDLMRYESPNRARAPAGFVDVNQVDYGIEYSARFPIRTSADLLPMDDGSQHVEWLRTNFDYTMEERERTLRDTAAAISRELNNGDGSHIVKNVEDGHGHGLDLAFEIEDTQKNRTWRVEWDGVGRSYSSEGELLDNSVRGGHIELVTPKFNPDPEDMERLFRAIESQGVVPSQRFGGGHINIDLAPFDGRPEKMARFIGVYLENRNMMSLLFQDPKRQLGAEAIDVSREFIDQLKNFSGTEEELKQILYDNRFFGQRVGRKTKNTQLNLIAYFQDVIPEDLIHEDFDMKNDYWRRTFDVNPKIRKLEFRLFNAPRNAAESALQIKFTRALMDRALNGDENVFNYLNEVDYQRFANDPQYARQEFERVMQRLNLDPDEYRMFFLEGMEKATRMNNNGGFDRMAAKFITYPVVDGWGEGVPARPADRAVGSSGRVWNRQNIAPEARTYRAMLQERARIREAAQVDQPARPGTITRSYDRVSLNHNVTLAEMQEMRPENRLMSLYVALRDKANPTSEETALLRTTFREVRELGTLRNVFTNSTDFSDSYTRWLSQQLPEQFSRINRPVTLEVYRDLLTSNDPQVRQRARGFFRNHPDRVDIFLNALDEVDSSQRTIALELLGELDRADIAARNNPGILGSVIQRFSNRVERTFNRPLLRSEDLTRGLASTAATYQEDVRVFRQAWDLARGLDTEDQWRILVQTLDSPNEGIRNFVRERSRADFRRELYWHSFERTQSAPRSFNMAPEDRAFYLRALNEGDALIRQMSIDQIKNLPPQQRLRALYVKQQSEALDTVSRVRISRLLNEPELLAEMERSVRSFEFNPDYQLWQLNQLSRGNRLTGLSEVDASSLRVRALFDLALSNDPRVRAKAIEISRGLPNHERFMVDILSEFYTQGDRVAFEIIGETLSEIQTFNSENIGRLTNTESDRLFQYLTRTLEEGRVDSTARLNIARSLVNSRSNSDVKAYLQRMATNPDARLRDIGIIALSGFEGEELDRALQQIVDESAPLSERNQAVLDRGIQRSRDALNQLDNRALRNMPSREAIYSSFKLGTDSGVTNPLLDFFNVYRRNPGVLDQFMSILQGNEREELKRWVLQQFSDPRFKSIYNANKSRLSPILAELLIDSSPELRAGALASLVNVEDQPLRFIAQYENLLLSNQDFVSTTFKQLNLSSENVARAALGEDFYMRVFGHLRSAPNQDYANGLTRVLELLPSPELDRYTHRIVLSEGAEIPSILATNIAQLNNSRRTIESFETVEALSRIDNTEIRAAAQSVLDTKVQRAISLTPGQVTRTTPIGELLTELFIREQRGVSSPSTASFLNSVRFNGRFKDYFFEHFERMSPDFQRWILSIASDESLARKLSLSQNDLTRMVTLAMNNENPQIRSLAFEIASENQRIRPGIVGRFLLSEYRHPINDEVLNLVERNVRANPSSPFYANFVGRTLGSPDSAANLTPQQLGRISEITELMPESSAGTVLQLARENSALPAAVVESIEQVERPQPQRGPAAIPRMIGNGCQSFSLLLRSI